MSSVRTPTTPGRIAPLVALALTVGVLSLAGCAKQPQVAEVPPAPLEVPVVPPRLVGPVVVEEPPTPTAEVPEPAPPRQRPPRPSTAKGSGGQGNEPVTRVEPAPESSGKTPESGAQGGSAPANTSAAAEPAPLLRTPDSADDEQVAKSVKDTLARAEANLNKLNYKALNAGAKQQYDMANRFIVQAQDALKGRRLDFARFVADKADKLSASLLNR